MPIRLSRHATLVHFIAGDGTRLEGRLARGAPERAVVLCHPHPLHGGSMLTPVIMTVEQVFQEAGFTTLAFNFRGVGGSEGEYGKGEAEVADVSGALAYLALTLGAPPRLQAVAGYSFGSYVAARAAATDPRVRFYLGVAPPLNGYDFGGLRAAICPIALIGARRDRFCDLPRLESLYLSLPATPWSRLLDTDHFFTDRLDELAQVCRDALAWAEGPGGRQGGRGAGGG
jgi:alpha/beta superfamily hydrolase